ncbi:signal peptidase I [Agarivorans albus]|uniref:signal peptidase I n=1 Tax=Agarivorans albus TaxID=182262 RepID=UPI00058C2996|nr:signal peptidase I [Agarivorans albus]
MRWISVFGNSLQILFGISESLPAPSWPILLTAFLGLNLGILLLLLAIIGQQQRRRKYLGRQPKHNIKTGLLWLLLLPVSTLLSLVLAFASGLSLYQVPSGSMLPTLPLGSIILVDRYTKPQRCDMVVFTHQQINYVKRLVAPPNSQFTLQGHLLTQQQKPWDCPQLRWQPPLAKGQQTIHLDEQQWFAMGDNRAFSFDSRNFGAIASKDIVGVVTLVWVN